jgi:hypothetical protein
MRQDNLIDYFTKYGNYTPRWHLPNPFIFEVTMDLSPKANTAAGPYGLK